MDNPSGAVDKSVAAAAESATMTCTDAVEAMGSYLAHELSTERRGAFVAHIRTCPSCHDKLLALEIFFQLAAGAGRD